MSPARHLRPVLVLFWSGNRRMLAAGAMLALSTVLAGIALLGLSGWFITATAIAGASVATALAFDVFAPSAGIRLLALGRTASRYGERLTTHDATLRVLAGLRERLFRGWARADASRVLAKRPSRLLFRLTVDIDALDSLYLRVIVPAFAATGAALAASVALGFLHPLLGLGAGLVLLPIGLGVPTLAARRAEKFSRRRAHALEVLRSRTIDLIRGQVDLVMANRLGAQAGAVARADTRLSEADDALNGIDADVGLALGIAGSALLAGTLLAAAALAERGMITAPLGAFAVLVGMACLEPFGALRRGAVEFGRTVLAARRIGPKLAEPGGEAALPAPLVPEIAIQLGGITAGYPGARRQVLADLSLRVRAGERIAVLGESGAGKSTLLSVLASELAPLGGFAAAKPATLLTQRSELFRDSLRGNLALARADATDREMVEALGAAGLDRFFAALPEGLDTKLGEGGAGLSGGQARRLALARLLLRDTPVWLLDEPTEGLDGPTARDVLARIDRRSRSRTLVIATHIRREAALADRLVLLRGGRIAAALGRGTAEYGTVLEGLRPD
ncbi:ATP-binding cassette domain-containing protein [Chelativorans sp. AA-79]|uniref:amino acid ABC transporter ATP-binding/permease protein n=1 Tax=Chelativorans sp. AA-79 TaxID=3028735 RepID=UPI0023F7B98D|nr:ATP-binding cassette domain-containing protein [Chelativorans sp. AA-79]WEX08284.1 ATP-binding cassette domain-containing protein [Chelativorans sp. AA-79]